MNGRGSTLIEVVLYLWCSVLFVGCACYLVLTLYSSIKARTSMIEGWTELAISMDRFIEDIKALPNGAIVLCNEAKKSVIFQISGTCSDTGNNDVCWVVDKKRLIRIKGAYSKEEDRVRKRSMSVLLDSVDLFECSPLYEDSGVCGLCCTIGKRVGKKMIELKTMTALPGAG